MELSTIVEIIEAYQPTVIASLLTQIYNSRNYRSILAPPGFSIGPLLSTIVEIIEAYQPYVNILINIMVSTIVEIIEAYQPEKLKYVLYYDLQQQKLQKHTSRRQNGQQYRLIYNSRNYRSILARKPTTRMQPKSTIVEIIEAYQPLI